MGELMAVAEMVDKLQAICVVCGDPACRNQRLLDGKPARYDSPTIMVGGRESYEARCRHCHQVPRQGRGPDGAPLAACRRCSTSRSPATSPPGKSTVAELFRALGRHAHRRRPRWCARRRRRAARCCAPSPTGSGRTCSTRSARSTGRRSAGAVMADPAALADLNRIVHPDVLRRRAALEAEARRAGRPDRGERHPPAVRGRRPRRVRRRRAGGRARRRFGGRGSWPSAASPAEDAERMLAAQAPSGPKRARSTYVIDNDGDRAALERAAREVWTQLVALASPARLTSPPRPPILPRATPSTASLPCRTSLTTAVHRRARVRRPHRRSRGRARRHHRLRAGRARRRRLRQPAEARPAARAPTSRSARSRR